MEVVSSQTEVVWWLLNATMCDNSYNICYERMTTHVTSGISSFFSVPLQFHSVCFALKTKDFRWLCFSSWLGVLCTKTISSVGNSQKLLYFLITLKTRQWVDTVSSHPQKLIPRLVTDFYPILQLKDYFTKRIILSLHLKLYFLYSFPLKKKFLHWFSWLSCTF